MLELASEQQQSIKVKVVKMQKKTHTIYLYSENIQTAWETTDYVKSVNDNIENLMTRCFNSVEYTVKTTTNQEGILYRVYSGNEQLAHLLVTKNEVQK